MVKHNNFPYVGVCPTCPGVLSPGFLISEITMIQLEFFPLSKEERLENEIQELRLSQEKVRKKLFAQNSELTKMYMQLHHEFEDLKRALCNGSSRACEETI